MFKINTNLKNNGPLTWLRVKGRGILVTIPVQSVGFRGSFPKKKK